MKALVFTDILDSTALRNLLGNEKMIDVCCAHFDQAKLLITRYGGYQIKTDGDSVMAVFHTATDALSFALSIHEFTGDGQVRIRAGVQVGQFQVIRNDIGGKMVNFAARLVSWPKDDWIILNDDAKKYVEDDQGSNRDVSFFSYETELKGFPGSHTLWRVQYHFQSLEINHETLATYLNNSFPGRQHANAKSVAALAQQLLNA